MNHTKTTDDNQERSCRSAQHFFHDIKIEFLIHELKSPVAMVETAVRSLLEARDLYGELNPKQEKALRRALRNAEKMRCMVYDLLEVGRSEADCFFCHRFDPAQVAFEVVVETVEAAVCKASTNGLLHDITTADDLMEYHVKVCVSETASALLVNQDEKKFRQIVSNLVKNALHYRHKWMEMHLAVNGDQLELRIVDDGPGIADEHHQAIFRPYTQVKGSTPARRGHGLGLAGARVVARCLGGEIHIESCVGRGATFFLELPLELPDMANQSHPED